MTTRLVCGCDCHKKGYGDCVKCFKHHAEDYAKEKMERDYPSTETLWKVIKILVVAGILWIGTGLLLYILYLMLRSVS